MRILRKTIRGELCELYATVRHERVLFGKGSPIVEVIEDIAEVSILGAGVKRKQGFHCKGYSMRPVCYNFA